MTSSMRLKVFSNKTLTRDQLIDLLNTALSTGENKYARHVAVMWLATYPGDLQVRLLYAHSLINENDHRLKQQALQILEEICSIDPEFIEAQKCLAKVQNSLGLKEAEITSNCVLALGGSSLRVAHGSNQPPDWTIQLRETRQLLCEKEKKASSKAAKDANQIEYLIHQVLVANPHTPLVAVTHLRVMQALGTLPEETLHNIAKAYYEHWPKCLPIMLYFAHSSMDCSDSPAAVSILHQTVSMDITGQVVTRLWGESHPYTSLWPQRLEIAPGNANSPQSVPVPASVAAAYGWNRLPPPSIQGKEESISTSAKNSHESPSDFPSIPRIEPVDTAGTPDQIHTTISNKGTSSAHREGRFPIYVVFSTHLGLEQHYERHSSALIEEAMHRLVNAVRGRHIGHQNWGAMLYLADDPKSAAALGITPARHNDPWSLKLALHDLDNALGKRGERIGALIVIGGPEIVPFHHLPNPVEDIDKDIPSDNPYGTRDENYFVLEWPVGRLPGGSGNDPTHLIDLINKVTEQHQNASRREPWYHVLWALLLNRLRPKQKRLAANLGYSAAVWRRASLAVYRSIGDPRSLLISPPVQACELDKKRNNTSQLNRGDIEPGNSTVNCLVLPSAQFGYFNLHGLSDASEWYGQRDPTDASDGPDFPIALRPQDIRNSGHAPRVVFSEACYGAFIDGKKIDDAISIKFLTSGTLAVVGSTSTCYGSISSPLIAADLLGRVYWGLISEGNLAGEALRRAKLYLAREMHQRQGFLDGEDQKTLISFVLYGDPLAQPYPTTRRHKLNKSAPDLPEHLLTLSDQQIAISQLNTPSAEITAHVKQLVKQYLPGMSDAQIKVTPASVLRHAGRPISATNFCCTRKHIDPHGRHVVILSKNIEQASLIHSQVARITMDDTGKLVKLVVSR